ncbi:MAG: hypothetical protein KJ592_03620 [Nanoarchaeota archaeon]|nr:hypothetical protein [Nanoarchaeota archaeon]
MNKKNLDYVVIGVVVVLLIGSIVFGLSFSSSENVKVSEDLDLEKYRSEDIPQDCRLPIYESRIESWKEHLSHHENTHYCLEYFE